VSLVLLKQASLDLITVGFQVDDYTGHRCKESRTDVSDDSIEGSYRI
jgi:hypothetical protein